jgi:hypothetical protein
MKRVIFFVVAILGMSAFSGTASAREKYPKFKTDETSFNFSDLKHRIFQPPLATRNCCAFGYDAKVSFFPMVKITQVVGLEDLTHHSYANQRSGKREQQGEMYSCHAGFLDTAHIRHALDWTAYFAVLLEKRLGRNKQTIRLLKEGGKRTLTLNPVDETLSRENIVTIAQRMSYDTTVWHEILTWYSPAVVAFFSEKHSSFAPEDNFSNLLGTYIARDALLSGRPFNQAAHEFTKKYLSDYDTRSRQEAFVAFDWVGSDFISVEAWWDRKIKMPNSWSVLKRHLNAYPQVTPWQVPSREYMGCEIQNPPKFDVPEYITTPSGKVLKITDLYKIEIEANKKVPVPYLTGRQDSQLISHQDFPAAVEKVKEAIILEFTENGYADPTVIE